MLGDEPFGAIGVFAFEQEAGIVMTGTEQFEPVIAEVDDVVGADHLAGGEGGTARDAGDHREAVAEVLERLAGTIGDLRLLGPVDYSAQGSVDVAAQGRHLGFIEEERERGVWAAHGRSIAGMDSRRIWSLAAVGTVAGAFSGLFGVGGGTVIVPMLIAFFAYGELPPGDVIVIVGAWAMAEHGNTAAPTATDKNTFHGLIMNTLCN
jgi:hypothetical protein